MHYAFHDFVGNVGLVLLLGTYLLLQTGRISSGQLRYSIFNAFASLLIGVSLIFKFNMSAFSCGSFLVFDQRVRYLQVCFAAAQRFLDRGRQSQEN